ncbi:PKD domain-containing protein [Chloroflexota bacterium]
MNQSKWLSKRLFRVMLVGVLLVVATSAGLGTSLTLAADNPSPDTEWEKIFGGSYYDSAESVQQTTDGGYIIAGKTRSYSVYSEWHIYLIKTDASGNMEWQQVFTENIDSLAGSIEQTPDGGYIIGGSIASAVTYTYDFYLAKTDASGNIEWEKLYGGSDREMGKAARQTTDGGYIIIGTTVPTGVGQEDIYLVKTDASGNIEWEKLYGGSGYDEAFDIRQTTDGGYIFTGYTDSNTAGWEDVYLVKIDVLGNIEWEKTIGGSEYDYAYAVEQTMDGGYIMAGETMSYGAGSFDFYLVKTDASGNTEWDTTYGGSDYEFATSLQHTTDGGYIVAGITLSYGAGSGDVYMVKTDASGNVEWEKTIGGVSSDYAHSVCETADGGYIMAGETSSYGAGSADVYLVKLSAGINTPVGSDVTVSLESGTVNFPSVNQSGTTTITTSTENPVEPTPSDFYVIAGEFIDITTTADYSGLITVGIAYDESQVGNEESLRLFHWNSSEWEDVTTSVDTLENIVYGQVTSLSPFFIGEPAIPPVAAAGGPYLIQVDCSVDLDGSASYHPDGTIVSYEWSFGDNTNGSGVSVSHTYTAVGIYDVNLTVTDENGTQSSDSTMVVVYDSSAGFVTGGGWIDSPEGAYTADSSLTGKANFGFVSKYQKGASVPTGQTEFRFKVADFNFHSSNYDWLVVAGAKAIFKGEGTINGAGVYKFQIKAIDADINPDDDFDIDRFRIKIWYESDETEVVIYDNTLEDDNDDITTEIGGGSIVIHED